MPDDFSVAALDDREADLIDVWTKDPAVAYAKLGMLVEDGFRKNFKKDKQRDVKTDAAFEEVMEELGALSQDFEKYQIQNEADKKALHKSIDDICDWQKTHEKKKPAQAHGESGEEKKILGVSRRVWVYALIAALTIIGGGTAGVSQIGG